MVKTRDEGDRSFASLGGCCRELVFVGFGEMMTTLTDLLWLQTSGSASRLGGRGVRRRP